jgi:hypothetical protein
MYATKKHHSWGIDNSFKTKDCVVGNLLTTKPTSSTFFISVCVIIMDLTFIIDGIVSNVVQQDL